MKHAWAALVAAGALLGGCASPGVVPVPAARTEPATLGLADDATTPAAPAQWWTGFGDPALDALVRRALADHPSLQAAQARLARAGAAVSGAQAADGPQLGLGLDATRQLYTENGLVPPPIAGTWRNTANAQLSLGWEWDFFGRQHAALKAALGTERAARAEGQAAAQAVATQVVRTHVALARVLSQRQVLERTLAQREQVLALTRQRVLAGLDTAVELRQAEGALPDLRQQIEALDEQAVLARHQLAALSGQAPDALVRLAPALAPLQVPNLPPRLGVDLLGRRADLVAARWRVEASQQDLAVARAQFYPNINLSAFVGLNAIGLDRLVQSGSQFVGGGPALRLPLFDAGRLRANLRGRAAELDAAVASYNATLLDAVREVADATGSLQSLQRQQAEQAQAQQAAEGAHDMALQRYRAGLGSYLVVLNAETAVLTQRRLGVDLKARVLDTQAQLMRVLGGGYHDDPPATETITRAATWAPQTSANPP
ncbi:efflux transporter, outer membrane factor lipoprotein, NodT family [Burkholderiales bacterium JOSHI_001]|nr:efflux transporter, outer membrane factor lipoprotein, NodT family [Burkholderiales bacterium JOSHI_001]